MDCKAASELVHRYIDGEIGRATSMEIERHLQECPECRRLYDAQRSLQGAVQRGMRYSAPPALAARIGAALDATVKRPEAQSSRRQAFALAASILLAVFAASGLTWIFTAVDRQDQLAQEVVSSHIRSLMGNHLTDVASSDQHTVKPWFNGRIDVAPPVDDLTAFGFPLVGGRMDYVDRRPVAALIYRRNQHIINLFMWPETGAIGDALPLTSLQGYNMRRWIDDGMVFWAVSDLNADELAAFERVLRSQP